MYDIELILERIKRATEYHSNGTLNHLDFILALQINAEELDLVYEYKRLVENK